MARDKTQEDPKSGAIALSVLDKKGSKVREYTFELHGEDMEKNATEYAKKIGGSVVKAR